MARASVIAIPRWTRGSSASRGTNDNRAYGWDAPVGRSWPLPPSSGTMIGRMFHLMLFQPEIPPNTGNVIRLCANVGATLASRASARVQHGRAALAPRGPRLSRAREREGACGSAGVLAPSPGPRGFSRSRRALAFVLRGAVRGRRRISVRPRDARTAAEVLDSFAAERRLRIPMRPVIAA